MSQELILLKKNNDILNSGERIHGYVKQDDGTIIEVTVIQKDGSKKDMKLSANETARKKRIKVIV